MELKAAIFATESLNLPYKQFVKQTEKVQRLAFPTTNGNRVSSDAFGESEEEKDKPKETQGRRSFYRKKGLGSAPVIRECARCKVRETPMWRSGPQGKGTLCNACGVKWSLAKHAKKPTTGGGRGRRPKNAQPAKAMEPRRPNRRGRARKDSEDEEDESSETRDSEKEDKSYKAENSADSEKQSSPRADKENTMDANEEFFKEGKYYCRYCDKTWSLDSFKNGQQFGAHCSNCSRRKRKPAPASVSSRRKDKKFIQRRTMERKAERERQLAAKNAVSNDTDISAASDQEKQSKKRKKESEDSDSKDVKKEQDVQRKKMKKSDSEAEPSSADAPNGATVKIELLGDLACTESIEEEAKESEEANNGTENNVHNSHIVNGEQRRSRKRKHVNIGGDRKGKEKVRHEDPADVEQDGSEEASQSEEEEDEFDDEGHDLKFYERVDSTVKGLITAISEARTQKKCEKKLNLLQRGLIVLRNDVKMREETQKKERKALKELVAKELTGMKSEFEYAIEVIKARFGYQLKSTDEEERSCLEAFSKHIEKMVAVIQGERDQISTLSTSQRTQNQLMSQLEQVTRLFGHGCEASLDAIRREGGETGRDCMAELDRVNKEFQANLQSTEEELLQLFLANKSSLNNASTNFRKNISDIDIAIKELELPSL